MIYSRKTPPKWSKSGFAFTKATPVSNVRQLIITHVSTGKKNDMKVI